ncbi:hypothetical protein ACPWML_26670, partial [Pandoraea pneumonica]
GGAGTLTLTGANAYAGGTTLNGGGGLVLGNGLALGTGTLALSGLGGSLSASVPGVALSNVINLNGAGLMLGGANSLTLAGAIG